MAAKQKYDERFVKIAKVLCMRGGTDEDFMEKYGIEELQKYCKRRLSYLSKRNRAKEALAC